jgi:LuxR family maltose regulon positive regulatory protein
VEEIAVIRACLARMPGQDPQATVALSLQVLGRLAKDDWVRRAALLYNLGWGHLRLGDTAAANRAFDDARHAARAGGSHYLDVLAVEAEVAIVRRQGRLHEAAAMCRKVLGDMLEPAEGMGQPLPISGALTISLGRIVLEQGDLEGAERLLVEGLKQVQGTLELASWARGYASLARLKQAQGDVSGALHSIERIEKLWPEMESDTYAAAFRVRIWLWQSQHDPKLLARAERDAREVLPHFDDGKDIPACADEWRYARCTALVRLRIAQRRAQGQPDLGRVLDFLARQLRVNEEGGWNECVIELLVLQALALDAQGDTRHALDAVRRALALAEPEGYLRIFVDEGPPMARLLHEAAARGIVPEYAGRLLAAFPAVEPPRDGLLRVADTGVEMVEPLSGRELEVLRLVAQGLSNREIAQTLVISPKTVKRHTSSIYGKLGVHSRTQAVAKARNLGILPLDRA